ncbi:MAG TPA: RDD family protein [Acidimicrobiales bacterium]|nr:RDD family protein [Acidimicrobiales bacterium]
MSDASEGPGWWMASDGKWYPPHLHPHLPPPPSGGPGAPGSAAPPSEGQPLNAPPPHPGYPPGYGGPPTYWPPPVPTPGGWGGPPPYAGPVDPVIRLPLAPWWKRLVAFMIDGLMLGLGLAILSGIVGAALGRNGNSGSASGNPISPGALTGAFVVLFFLASVPLSFYYGFTNGSRRGQTVGKMAMGIAVRDARTGRPIGFWRAFGRYWITVVFSLVLYLPYVLDSLSPLWDARRQSWHDKVARSVVIDLRP